MRRRILATAIISLTIISLSAQAEGPRSVAGKGVKHFQKKEYERALADFMKGLELAPDRQELRYDHGTALYKLDNYPQAAESFANAAGKQTGLSADAWYNLGNSMFKAQKPADAVKAYKNALRLDHEDRDAKHNLELALRMMQMQQQQSSQDSSGQRQDQQQPQPQKQQEQQSPEQQQRSGQAQPDSTKSPSDSTSQATPRDKQEMSPEEAMQLLQAMESVEQDALKDKLERQFGRPKRAEKDW